MPRLTWALAICLSAHGAHAGPVEDAQAAEATGDVARALAAWQRAAELAPEDARAQLSVGRLQLRAGRPAEAVQTLAAVVEKHPETPGAHYWYAFSLRKSGRLPAAADAYRRALDAAPEDPDPRFGLAETLKQMGDGAGALEAYKAYVRLESRPSEAKWVARANDEIVRLSASDVVTPAEAPTEPPPAPGTAPPTAAPPPTAATPGDARTPEAAFAAGRFSEAQQGFRDALERSPDNLALHHRTAVAALTAGDYPEAERRAVTVVRLDPDNPTATAVALAARARRPPVGPPARAEAELALREGRNRTAAELAGALLTEAPTGPDAAALAQIRGTALLRLGRADEAAEALRRTASQGQPPGEWWLALGDALSAQGDRPAARRAWRVAADLTEAETPIGRQARERIMPPGLRVSEE
jgi:tetratricopeptide (TPR) repeat protein